MGVTYSFQLASVWYTADRDGIYPCVNVEVNAEVCISQHQGSMLLMR